MPDLIIDVVSDVVCPWCFVGKRRLEAALKQTGAEGVSVRWRPYQLDPSLPVEGLDRTAYMRAKFGDDSRLAEVHERLESLGAEVGIQFGFDRIRRAPNTLDAHRLVRWAGQAGAQEAMVERLFSDYFESGRDIGDPKSLAAAAEACGLDGESTRRRLAGPDDVAEVRADIEQARGIGVSGVPFFIFASKFAVSGAQAPDVLARAIEKARKDGQNVEFA
jgi:predicted DsbA family dithiol-disulfide isomerase